MHHPQRRASGFTLIEPLVVIAIIAILAAILFPVFAKAREKARQISDLSNIKQVNLGLLQYLQDYDETFPPTVSEREGPASINSPSDALRYSIRGRLSAYVSGGLNTTQSGNIWADPSATIQWPAQSTSGSPSSSVVYWPSDFGFNINEGTGVAQYGSNVPEAPVFAANPTFGFNETVTLAKIQSPAKFLILADTARGSGVVSRGAVIPQYLDPTTLKTTISLDETNTFAAQTGQAALAPRHTGGYNVGYSDGHAKWRIPGPGANGVWRNFADNDFRTDPASS